MHLSDFPVEVVKNICSFLGGDAYVASMVPYLRSCVEKPDRKEFMVQVYKREDFAFIYLYDLFPTYDVVERCVSAVVKKENLTILGWLLAKSKNKLLLMIAEKAALYGSYQVLTWAMYIGASSDILQGCPVSSKMTTDVVNSCNTKLSKLLYFLGYRYTESVRCAAFHDDLDVLSLFKIEYYMEDVLRNSARGGNLETLKKFHQSGVLLIDPVMQAAYSTLQREIVLYFKDKCDLSAREYIYSALSGGKSEEEILAFLQFLEGLVRLDYDQIANMTPCFKHMSIIRWCLDKGAEKTPVMFSAACRNSVQDMDYLDSLGCYRENSRFYFNAIDSRKVENLEWLRKKGCPIPQDLTVFAIRNKVTSSLIPCFEWCLKQGLHFSTKLLQDCILQEEMDLFHWLLDKVSLDDEHLMWRCLQTSINKPNLEAFSVLCVYDHEKKARKEIEEKKKTYSNYLLLEEMEKLLDY
nr:hypothetical protein Cduv_474 [Cedratvirus duvanny]